MRTNTYEPESIASKAISYFGQWYVDFGSKNQKVDFSKLLFNAKNLVPNSGEGKLYLRNFDNLDLVGVEKQVDFSKPVAIAYSSNSLDKNIFLGMGFPSTNKQYSGFDFYTTRVPNLVWEKDFFLIYYRDQELCKKTI